MKKFFFGRRKVGTTDLGNDRMRERRNEGTTECRYYLGPIPWFNFLGVGMWSVHLRYKSVGVCGVGTFQVWGGGTTLEVIREALLQAWEVLLGQSASQLRCILWLSAGVGRASGADWRALRRRRPCATARALIRQTDFNIRNCSNPQGSAEQCNT